MAGTGGGDEKTIFTLDLDNKDLVQKALESKEAVASIGDASNLTGLIEGLVSAGPLLGVLGVAALALKTTFESVFDAEKIKLINTQFETLSGNAGIASEHLKEALVGAAGGRATETELLQAANKAIVELGHNAERIPESMELARKATTVFGGDLVERFEMINQAVATGQSRQLRGIGINVNFEASYIALAKSLNKTAAELTDGEKQQARMNAVLAKGDAQFKGTKINVDSATSSWVLLKTAIKETMEGISLAIDKVAGPTVRAFLSGFKDMATDFATTMRAKFGDGAEAAKAKTQIMGDELMQLKGKLIDADQAGQMFFNGTWVKKGSAEYDTAIKQMEDRAEELKKTIGQAHEEIERAQKASAARASGGDEPEVDPLAAAKAAEQKAKFAEQLSVLEEKRIQTQQRVAESVEEVERLDVEQRQAMAENLKARLDMLQVQADKTKITEEEKNNKIREMALEHNAKLAEMDDQLEAKREASLKKFVKASTSASDGMARGFSAGSKKAQLDLNNWGAAGTRVFGSFQKNAVSSLEAWGAGTKTASEAAKGFIFGMLADEALARGTIMLMSSIWPPNPVGLAGGAALIAFSGALRAAVGGGGGGGSVGSSVSSGGDIGAAGGGGGGVGDVASAAPEMTQQAKKVVSLNIQGNYFDTEQTNRHLVEMIRNASDATDFQFNKIG